MRKSINRLFWVLVGLSLAGYGPRGLTPSVVAGEPDTNPASYETLQHEERNGLQKERGTSMALPMMDPSLEANLPIYIDSQEMTVRGGEGKVLFNGAVKIQRGDVTMKADYAEVFLSEQASKSDPSPAVMKGKKISKIEIRDHVELTQGDRRVAAQRGLYDAHRQELVFSGEPEMWEEGYNIKGKVIILSLAQKRSIIEGSRLTIN